MYLCCWAFQVRSFLKRLFCKEPESWSSWNQISGLDFLAEIYHFITLCLRGVEVFVGPKGLQGREVALSCWMKTAQVTFRLKTLKPPTPRFIQPGTHRNHSSWGERSDTTNENPNKENEGNCKVNGCFHLQRDKVSLLVSNKACRGLLPARLLTDVMG